MHLTTQQERRLLILDAIERHVETHPTVSFTERDGQLSRRLNTAARDSLDPRVRDLWEEYDACK